MQCNATARSGQQCGRSAMKGGTVCASHGGKSPRALEAAAQRVEKAKAAKAAALFAAPVDVDPAQALIDLVHWTAGEVEYWREQVRELADTDPDALTWGMTREKTGGDDYGTTLEAKPNVAYVMLTDAQERLAKFATAALKAGVDERRVRIAESQGALVADVIKRILDRLDLLEWQAELVPTIVPEELRALSAGL